MKAKCPRAALPPDYALELLTIYAWEMGTQENENFRLDKGFTSVMELLQEFKFLCIYWTKYYTFQNPVIKDFVRKQLKRDRYWAPASLPHLTENRKKRGKGSVALNGRAALSSTKITLTSQTFQNALVGRGAVSLLLVPQGTPPYLGLLLPKDHFRAF